MSIASPITQRVVTQQLRSDVAFHAESNDGVYGENGIHVNFETGAFYTKIAGSDSVVYNRIQDMFTFTGGNQSMYRGSAGLLTQAVTNTPRLEYSNSTIGTNLLLQSQSFNISWSLEQATIGVNVTTAPDSTTTANAIVEDGSTATHDIFQTVSKATTAATYTFSCFLKANNRTAARLFASNGGGTANANVNLAAGTISVGAVTGTFTSPSTTITAYPDGWYRCTLTFTTGTESSVSLIIGAQNPFGTSSYAGTNTLSAIFIWGAQFELGTTASVYTRTTSTAPAYTNSAPKLLGLLMEASRTNLILQSQDLTTSWSNDSSSTSANSTAAPDGTATADTVVESATTAPHGVFQAVTITAAATYSASVFVKAKERTKGFIQVMDVATSLIGFRVFFDLTAGTLNNPVALTTGTITSSTITPYANGWYRVSVTGAIGGVITAARLYIASATVDGSTSYAGDGASGIYFWGGQVEAGNLPTSYIPTTTASITRTADSCTRTLGAEFSATAGTVFVNGRTGPANNADNYFASLGSSAGVNDYRLLRQATTTTVFNSVFSTSTNVALLSLGNAANFSTTKIAAAYAVNDFAATLNGSTIQTDVAGAVPVSPTTLKLGTALDGTGALFGHIKIFDYYPERKINQRLIEMST
jgi:hypothetical protein